MGEVKAAGGRGVRREERAVRFGRRGRGNVLAEDRLDLAFDPGLLPFQAFFPLFFLFLQPGNLAVAFGAFISSVFLGHGTSFLSRRASS